MTRGRVFALSLALAACGSDVAQTAVRPDVPTPFDCHKTSEQVTLPTDPALGGGDEPSSSPLLGGSYGTGQGPGIAIVARDGFRLYQNGDLVAERTTSLVPEFFPLTFLPGDNVVSIVTSSPDRAPALLVHVDELERAYVSDGSWKVSTAPNDDFRQPGYDASGWDDALDHGLAVAMPGCEPPPGFVPGSTAHWIGTRDDNARTAVFRLAIRIAPLGFGALTTGGEGATPVVARDVDELGMLLASEEPAVILVPEERFDARRTGADIAMLEACPLPCNDGSDQITYTALPDGMCEEPLVPLPRDERRLTTGPNKTLIGLGRGSILRGVSLSIGQTQNVIVRNLAFYDVNPEIIEAGDGVTIEGSSRVWLDHLTFRWIGDGFVNVIPGSTDLTLSWIHFDGRSEFACGGHHPRANELSDAVATIHHSFYDYVTGRAPMVNRSLARVHVVNNRVSDNPDFGVGASCDAQVLLEGSFFERVAHPTLRRDCLPDSPAPGLIFAPEGSNGYEATGAHQLAGADSDEPRDPAAVFPLPYAPFADDLDEARFTVPYRAGAGSRWAQPFELD